MTSNPAGVSLSGEESGLIRVPDVVGFFDQLDSGAGRVGIGPVEETDLDGGRVLREEREIYSAPVPGRAERKWLSGSHPGDSTSVRTHSSMPRRGDSADAGTNPPIRPGVRNTVVILGNYREAAADRRGVSAASFHRRSVQTKSTPFTVRAICCARRAVSAPATSPLSVTVPSAARISMGIGGSSDRQAARRVRAPSELHRQTWVRH